MTTNPHPQFIVTGGAGFLGRFLVRELKNRFPGASITVVDRQPSCACGVEFVRADIAQESLVRPLLKRCDGVFHLAAVVGVDAWRNHPEEVRKVNLEDTKTLIDWCGQENVKKFVFVSSFEVYGNAPEAPYQEDTEPEPISLYGQCKAEVERYLKEVAHRTGMKVSVVRPLNMYGPGQRPDFVVSRYLEAAGKDEDLVVFGDGQQTRCFTYVEDAARGLVDAFQYEASPYEIFNIGSDAQMRIRDLAELVRELVPGCQSKIVYQEYGKEGRRKQAQEMQRQIPSLEKAHTLLGFQSSTDMRQGIVKTLASKHASSSRPIRVCRVKEDFSEVSCKRQMKQNIDPKTVESFGFEWSQFDQRKLSERELQEIFGKYFRIFPWEKLPENAVGFDIGCGSGRWAKYVAPRVGTLYCIDASEASIRVAKENLKRQHNCLFHAAAIDNLPLQDGSMDFGYALGVLHHVPDTAGALGVCAAKLKAGAPLLVYIYYAFDNRPMWFRALWKVTDIVRRVISRCPIHLRYIVSQGIAVLVYYPLARTLLLMEKMGLLVDSFPLAEYRTRSFSVMRNDAYDRFATRLEKRFSAQEIKDMMEAAGLERIVFSDFAPFWCAVGFKKA